ncbi:MAG TPA: alkaline phosphatase family protein [Candidatus Cybelea sp.]|jgi:phospholipase C
MSTSFRAGVLTSFIAGLIAIAGCSNGAAPPLPAGTSATALHHRSATGSSPIQHVVLIIQENRSFDNFFDCFKGTACVKRGMERVKQDGKYVDKPVTLAERKLVPPKGTNHDIGHCYYAFSQAWDQGSMDGFNQEPLDFCPRSWGGGTGGPPANTFPYQYVNHQEIAPYWDMAKQYALADAMFQTQGSSSFTAHQDLIRGGTAIGGAYGSSASLIDTPTGTTWGCDAPDPKERTNLITTALKWEENAGPFPCTSAFPGSGANYTTLRDLLDAHDISWKYYSPCYPQSNTPKCAGNKCTQCDGAQLNAFDVIAPVRNGPEWGTNVSMPSQTILNDVKKNRLPAVSWVIPDQNNSDHPGDTVDDGPEWVASIVNAVGKSPYWSSSAIVVVWDDWGGMYDHVAPPALSKSGSGRDDQGGLGFRVPMIVISPYVPQGIVSHTQYEFGSIIKYVEANWNLGSLNTTDQRANSIGDIFNYKQQPRSFIPIRSRLSADFFERQRPSDLPADNE